MAILFEPIDRFTRARSDPAEGAGNNRMDARLIAAMEVYGRLVDQFRDRPEDMAALLASETDAALQTVLRHMTDRVAFAREVLGFVPEPQQDVALRSWARRIILNCNRQWGKSTVCAIRALHRAWFWPGSLILLVSRAHPQSGGLMQKIRAFLPALDLGGGRQLQPTKGDGVNRLSLQFPNGSRIVALPGGQKPTRSYSKVAMVIVDEAGMVPDPVHDAVAPTLVRTNGELILASTPMGKRGAFYRTWQYGGEGWLRVFGPVDESKPGKLSLEFLKDARARRGEDYYAQEYLCQFLDADSHLFSEDAIQKVIRQDVETWEEGRRPR